MLDLFKRKRADKKAQASAEKATHALTRLIQSLQSAWVQWMSEQESKMTATQKKSAFACFVLIMLMAGGYFLYQGLFAHLNHAPAWLKPPTLTLPTDTRLPDSLNVELLKELYKQKHVQQTDSIHHQ